MTAKNYKLDLKFLRQYTLDGDDGLRASGLGFVNLITEIFKIRGLFVKKLSAESHGSFVLTRVRPRDEGQSDPLLELLLRLGFTPKVVEIPNPGYPVDYQASDQGE